MRNLPRAVAQLAAFVLTAVPLAATAQDVDSSVEVELFEPALGPHAFLTVGGAEIADDKQFALGLTVTYLSNPFTVYNVDAAGEAIVDTRTSVVKSMIGGHLGGFYGLKGRYQVGVSLPVVFAMSGDGVDPSTADPTTEGLSVMGLGDARLEFAARLWQRKDLSVSVVPAITVPSSMSFGSDNAWLGDDLPTFRPRAAAEWTNGKGLVAAANLGFIFRKPRTVYSSDIGQMVTFGGAISYQVLERLGVMAEVFGRNGFSTSLNTSPVEADAAVRVKAMRGIYVLAGGGAGIIKGLGSPDMRLFASLGWAPDFRDSDGDGVPNDNDRCPALAEDRDNYMDKDGCPDADNDSDLLDDLDDKCPNEAEDKDGFQDDDGCPDPDNDKDGIADEKDQCPTAAEDQPGARADGCPASSKDSDDDGVNDAADKCPNDAEDMDGFEDADGCPDPDNDKDLVPDESDQCPAAAEDVDKYLDEDGCPDPDNDEDGFLDSADKCPDAPEVVNGIDDFDGCPDRGGRVAAHIEGDRVVFDAKVTFKWDLLTKPSKEVIDQAAANMRAQRGVKKWRVVVAAEKQSNDETTRKSSQTRADAVKAQLVSRGIPADTIESIGAVSDNPTVVIIASERDPAATPPPANGGQGAGDQGAGAQGGGDQGGGEMKIE